MSIFGEKIRTAVARKQRGTLGKQKHLVSYLRLVKFGSGYSSNRGSYVL